MTKTEIQQWCAALPSNERTVLAMNIENRLRYQGYQATRPGSDAWERARADVVEEIVRTEGNLGEGAGEALDFLAQSSSDEREAKAKADYRRAVKATADFLRDEAGVQSGDGDYPDDDEGEELEVVNPTNAGAAFTNQTQPQRPLSQTHPSRVSPSPRTASTGAKGKSKRAAPKKLAA